VSIRQVQFIQKSLLVAFARRMLRFRVEVAVQIQNFVEFKCSKHRINFLVIIE